MPPEESREAKYERLKKHLQASILRDYPNPERKGCPGDAVLRALATRPLSESIDDDPNWQHVTHCAECYREFLEFSQKAKQRAITSKRLALGGIAAALMVFGIYLAIRAWRPGTERPQIAELQYRKTLVDIESMTRSGDANGEKKPIVLEREPKELTVRLPVGSRSGTYDFQIRDAWGKTVISKQQSASIHDGTTEFVVLLNLSELAAGHYSMQVRRVPFDWTYYPVVLR